MMMMLNVCFANANANMEMLVPTYSATTCIQCHGMFLKKRIAANGLGSYWPCMSLSSLSGTVPLQANINPSILNLTHLHNLNLSSQYYWGSVNIPKFMGCLVSLRYLSSLLSLGLRNSYDGLYVDNLHWISHLFSLEFLDLSSVNLSKASDQWLFAMNTIPSLRDRNTHIHFPSHINLTSLETLDLSFNSIELREPIPCTFPNNMTLLKYLDLSGNNIDSLIPNCFYNFPNLEHLHLTQTKLRGIISSHHVANLTSIEVIIL
ncbi:hypothetical protein F8388_024560 [Cannabis sativa]|uniref:Uncharacterized protein n=1 Tax=Cannabis sativa TaxID=3483 RepID=A0A7J6GBU8_CANSA|nr:hypothetical protein F8388_024560 [Cannabis sativa]